ncbi:hypothetical protein RN001_008209 [Aquatica leii]|uniref:L-threonine 3-dehydrogenase, mitochondrial n=1 Tax=Aquatica leii TaxID=1421715 RepID=A0AAN7SP61_9COLE|nr:hypothetical protein RN001_008209 [Aquatica leii]
MFPRTFLKTISAQQQTIRHLCNNHWQNGGGAKSENPTILITGGLGQLGVECGKLLRSQYGAKKIILSDIREPSNAILQAGPYHFVDILDPKGLEKVVVDNKVDWIVHLSATLSAKGELDIPLATKVNIQGMHNIIELANHYKLRLFVPSTIGAFGPDSPRNPTPNITVQRPRTIYGVSKVYAELLGEYYHHKFNLDFRCLRLPGVVSCDLPGGGTTDYAIDMFHSAMTKGTYECYLTPKTTVPMIYITDCLRAINEFLVVPTDTIQRRVYNIHAMSFHPEGLAKEIQNYYPAFEITYKTDPIRQEIADSWPEVLDDTEARKDWGWNPKYDFKKMVQTMVDQVKVFYDEEPQRAKVAQ